MTALAATTLRRLGTLPPTLLFGAVVVGLFVLLAVLGPWIAPYDYDAFNVRARLQPPGPEHWLGTDEFGRDVLSRVLAGAPYSLTIGIGAAALSLVLGVPLGLIAAYDRRGGELIMRGVDVLISVPPILLGLLLLAVTTPSLGKTILAVGLVYVPVMTRITRSVALALLAEDFIEAARARDEHVAYMLLREILPNAWPPIIVETSLRITFAVLLGSALSFLGLGAQPPLSEWGLMIAESRAYIDQAPWIGLAPGVALCLLLIAVNLLGEGLREALDPRLIRRGAP
ncbi:MAG: ABC transporter permease [Proteobacteria bacterium]|nr:ABC transporter permease [Pseudomonadota bacterium]